MRKQKDYEASGWVALLSLVAWGIYAFILSLIGGTIVWLCLGLGLSYEAGIAAVLVFFVTELLLFLSSPRRSPAARATRLLLVPIILVAKQIVRVWPCRLSRNIERDVMRQLIKDASRLWDPA